MLYSYFRQESCHNLPTQRLLKSDPLEKCGALIRKNYKIAIFKLYSLGGIAKKIQATLASNLAVVSVMSLLCGAPAAYLVVSGRYLLAAWAVSVFLAWVFLFGAAIATKKAARDKDSAGKARSHDIISTIAEFRPEALDPKTSGRASLQRRSADKFFPFAESDASKQSSPLWFTEEEKLSRLRTVAVSGRSRSRL